MIIININTITKGKYLNIEKCEPKIEEIMKKSLKTIKEQNLQVAANRKQLRQIKLYEKDINVITNSLTTIFFNVNFH